MKQYATRVCFAVTADRFNIAFLVVLLLLALAECLGICGFSSYTVVGLMWATAVSALAIPAVVVLLLARRLCGKHASFGVRSLFLLVVAAAILCSWWRMKIARAAQRREMLVEMAPDFKETMSPPVLCNVSPTLRNLMEDAFGEEFFAHVIGLGFYGRFDRQFLPKLGAIQSLESLTLPNAVLDDSDLVYFETFHQLKRLKLCDSQLSDLAIRRLQRALPACEILLISPQEDTRTTPKRTGEPEGRAGDGREGER